MTDLTIFKQYLAVLRRFAAVAAIMTSICYVWRLHWHCKAVEEAKPSEWWPLR